MRRRIRRRSHRTTNRSDAEGEEDSNKSISNSDNDDYSVDDGPEKNTNSDDDIIGDEEGDHKGKPCNEVDNRDAPDFDRLCKITYMERLYNDILSQHHGHNKGESLKWQCGDKFATISKTWTIKNFLELSPHRNNNARIVE